MTEEKFFTVAEAAKILNLTDYTIRKKIREGQIKAVQGSSDREGYRIPQEEITRYLQNKGRGGIASSFIPGTAGLGFMSPVMPVVGGVMSGIFSGLKRGHNQEKIRDITIGGLQDEIEAMQYLIQSLELDGENISIDGRKKIFEYNARIKLLERQIKEIELQYEMRDI